MAVQDDEGIVTAGLKGHGTEGLMVCRRLVEAGDPIAISFFRSLHAEAEFPALLLIVDALQLPQGILPEHDPEAARLNNSPLQRTGLDLPGDDIPDGEGDKDEREH